MLTSDIKSGEISKDTGSWKGHGVKGKIQDLDIVHSILWDLERGLPIMEKGGIAQEGAVLSKGAGWGCRESKSMFSFLCCKLFA
jgi:hypothetical protein